MIIPRPTYTEPDSPPESKTHRIDPELIRLIFDTSWKCKDCGATMCGTMTYCFCCKHGYSGSWKGKSVIS